MHKSHRDIVDLLNSLDLTVDDLTKARLPEHLDELDLLCMVACRTVPTMPRYLFATVPEAVNALTAHKAYHGTIRLIANGRTDSALNLYRLTMSKTVVLSSSLWAAPTK